MFLNRHVPSPRRVPRPRPIAAVPSPRVGPRIFVAARAAALLALALMTAGCGSVFPPLLVESSESGVLTMAVHGASIPHGETLRIDLFRKEAPAKDEDGQLFREIPLDQTDLEVPVENIAVGIWHVRVRVLDADGFRVYEGLASANVSASKTESVQVDLEPVAGQLAVVIDPGEDCMYVLGMSGCLHEHADRITMRIDPAAKLVKDGKIDWTAGSAKQALPISTMPPGTYEIELLVYHTARQDTNILVQSPRLAVEILPDRTTTVTWKPAGGSLHVGVSIVDR